MVLSYLVSTAGHAQEQNDDNPHDIRSVLQLIEEGADEFGDEKVVGFTSVGAQDGDWMCDRYSFVQLLDISDGLIQDLIDDGVEINRKADGEGEGNSVVSLLCPTGLDFLVAWIALMRMGYGVVLIAPQCSPTAVQSLISSSSSHRLIYHPKYTQLAQAALDLSPEVPRTVLPAVKTTPTKDGSTRFSKTDLPPIDPESVSHVFHSSGTSGTPKPIPHTHVRSVSVLPRRALPSYIPKAQSSRSPSSGSLPPGEPAAYTTTPLFHGGVSDLLRAWMARSMLYLYPTSDVPITMGNVVASVVACNDTGRLEDLGMAQLSVEQRKERRARFEVKAFLSVPYILTILAEDLEGPGMEMLKGMDFVSTGGAPLDTRVGDDMVARGVRLVSRLGSSECGFLMSSHRDYETEKDWELLRNDSAYADALVFEPQGDEGAQAGKGACEMVVTDRWLSKTKSNRPDGSYATGDLYTPHPTKPNVWRYFGRGDDVIVMSNGEKASPGAIETVFRSSTLFSDALVVGADRPQLGLILFAKPSGTDDKKVGEEHSREINALLETANAASPSFAQLSRDMCTIITDQERANALPKSSKGTVQRGVAYDVFKVEIDALYGSGEGQTAEKPKRQVGEIRTIVKRLVEGVGTGKGRLDELEDDTDLFGWGVDSLMATRIRAGITKELNTGSAVVPVNVVFEHPTISRLSQHILDLQEDKAGENKGQSAQQLMLELAEKYSSFPTINNKTTEWNGHESKSGKTILLTGATGSLGSFILARLLSLTPDVIRKVICLVRAEDDKAAMDRIRRITDQRGCQSDTGSGRVVAFAAKLDASVLGLEEAVYEGLKGEVDVILHAAWPVHFASSLTSFESSIKGTHNLLNLLLSTSNPSSTFYYCSSLASVLGKTNWPNDLIPEKPSDDPKTASGVGYSQSKWVTERVCAAAREALSPGTGGREGREGSGRVHVLRVGQLCGDTVLGYWNEKEGWPLLVRTGEVTGCLPMLDEEPSWLPVDLAANTIVDIILQDDKTSPPPFIYHVVHPHTITWRTILDGFQAAGMSFDIVKPLEWLDRVRKLDDEDASRQMLSLWDGAYGNQASSERPSPPAVSVENAPAASETLRDIGPLGATDVSKMVEAWRRSGFLHYE